MNVLSNVITRRLFLTLFIVTCVLMLTACGSLTVTPQVQQESLLKKCLLTLPKVEGMTGADWLLQSKQWSEQYHECAITHNGLVDILRGE